MNILQLLASSSFITLNKNVIKAVGLEESLLLGELSSEYDYWMKRGELNDGWFFSTVENVEENTTLNDYKQRKAITNLQNMGVLQMERKGIPAKRYFKINEEKVVELLDIQSSKAFITSSQKFKELDTENFETNKNITKKNKSNKNTEISTNVDTKNGVTNVRQMYGQSEDKCPTRFKRPSFEEVAMYCCERKNNIDAQYFLDYYDAKGWMIGKNHIKDWKACVRTWERNNNGRSRQNIPESLKNNNNDDWRL